MNNNDINSSIVHYLDGYLKVIVQKVCIVLEKRPDTRYCFDLNPVALLSSKICAEILGFGMWLFG